MPKKSSESNSTPESLPREWTWTVPDDPAFVLERADRALQKMLEPLYSISRNQIQRLIEEGHVTQDSVPLQARSKFKRGSVIRVEFPAPQQSVLIPEDRPLEILYEDSHLLVVNKPQGLTVHPSPTQMEGTLVHALLHHVQDLSGIGGVLRPGIVHRIDKDTSGTLVITKNDTAHAQLAQIFAKHDIERVYWALCYGSPSEAADGKPTRISSLIGRSLTDRKKMSMTVPEGRPAVTYYKRLTEYGCPKKKPFASLLEVTLETGRTHQIRVHLTGAGHSILGDGVYGTPSDNHPKWIALPPPIQQVVRQLPGQALHARVLGFKHPITGVPLRFEAEPPAAFSAVLKELAAFS